MTRKVIFDLLDSFLGRHSVQTLTREIRASIQAARPRSTAGATRSTVKVMTNSETATVMRNLASKRRER